MRKTTGISLLLLIFLSLCMITFSLLSLSGASADEKLSEKSAIHTTQYYSAVSTANEILAFLDHSLLQFLQEELSASFSEESAAEELILQSYSKLISDIHSDPDFAEVLSTKFADCTFAFEEINNTCSLSFAVPVPSDYPQQLLVSLELIIPETLSDSLYEITAWQVNNISNWNPDHSQNLMRMTEFSSVNN